MIPFSFINRRSKVRWHPIKLCGQVRGYEARLFPEECNGLGNNSTVASPEQSRSARPNRNSNTRLNFARSSCVRSMVKILPLTRKYLAARARLQRLSQTFGSFSARPVQEFPDQNNCSRSIVVIIEQGKLDGVCPIEEQAATLVPRILDDPVATAVPAE